MMPVDIATLSAFIVAATALVISPGPDTILIIRYTLASGRRVGLAAVAGVQMGLVIHTTLAVAGISLIIASSPILFKAVATLGALYLGWLGLQGFRGGGALKFGGGASVTAAKALRDGALCNLLNPKVILLFLALIPNFIEPERDNTSAQLITFAATLIILNSLWQAPLAWAAEKVRGWLTTPSVTRAVSRISGIILLGFAGLMIYDNILR
ncbi:MAG: LysE family translocator [Rhodospirillaceae bacterium]|nr:LysE family translocator [Rhodospirillaceae bacterium]